MKNVFLAFVLFLVVGTAFAGSCETGNCGSTTSRPVASATVNVGRRVVQTPVRFFSRLKSRVAARQGKRSALRASCSRTCSSCGCGC